MSWHRLWHQQDDSTRPEGPASKLRQEMRRQAREDARRMVVNPTGPRQFTKYEPPSPIVPDSFWRVD